ncbi:hypothetical protein F2Q70_00005064 [Brassica cretica]|uniref:Uncharacterized protein n=1 Tax=Brassica cretica TaxID=69181 RepID=A0A8S9IXQ3_BRACR|nr:hypothetical protein F2Q70_00005064 [Brassica cretica]
MEGPPTERNGFPRSGYGEEQALGAAEAWSEETDTLQRVYFRKKRHEKGKKFEERELEGTERGETLDGREALGQNTLDGREGSGQYTGSKAED